MSRLEDLPSWPVRHLVDAIGSTDHAPGGGAAGAVAIALAAACARKAILITLKRRPGDAELEAKGVRLGLIADAALESAAGDAVAFAALIAAYQQPHDSEPAAAARKAAIRARAASTAQVGVDLKALAIETRSILNAIEGVISPVMANDISAAVALVAAGEQIQDDNIRENGKAGG